MTNELKTSWLRGLVSLAILIFSFSVQAQGLTRRSQAFFDAWKTTNTHQEKLKETALHKYFEFEQALLRLDAQSFHVLRGYGSSADPLDFQWGVDFFRLFRELSGSVENAGQAKFIDQIFGVHELEMIRHIQFSQEKMIFIKKMSALLADKNPQQAKAAQQFLHDLQVGNTDVFREAVHKANLLSFSNKQQNLYRQFLQIWAPAIERVKNPLDLKIFELALDTALTNPAAAEIENHRLRRVVRAIGDFSPARFNSVRDLLEGTERGLERFSLVERYLGLSRDADCEISLSDF